MKGNISERGTAMNQNELPPGAIYALEDGERADGTKTAQDRRAAEVEEAAFAVMETLGEYAASIWGDVLAAVVSAVFAAKIDAAEIEMEEKAIKAIRAAEG